MRLEGWNHIPRGYGADFDVAAAPWWLRLWSATPFVDRFAHPRLVQRGLGYLTPFPGWPEEEREAVSDGWRLREPGHLPPGAVTILRREPTDR